MVMAGGEGERLYPLTQHRTKAAVPFAANYRIIDFTLSNCLNSGVRRIQVLTQYKSDSLNSHIRWGWDVFSPELGHYIKTVPPQQRIASHWYLGTADAVFQNIHALDEERPDCVLVLSGDHVYRMDYRSVLHFHNEREADLTICCIEMPLQEAARLGVVGVDEDGRVTELQEKPAHPRPCRPDAEAALCSMGIYVFRTDKLVQAVIQDAKTDSEHDFARNVVPAMLRQGNRVLAYPFGGQARRRGTYWKDIGTLDAYWRANMDFLPDSAPFDLHDPDWPIRSYPYTRPPTGVSGGEDAEAPRRNELSNCLIGDGVRLEGATVRNSVVGPNVRLGPRSVVEHSILIADITVGSGARVEKAVVDRRNHIPDGARIGVRPDEDSRHFTISPEGVAAVPLEMPLFRGAR